MLPSEAMEESKMGKDKELSIIKTKVTARRQSRRPANGTKSSTDTAQPGPDHGLLIRVGKKHPNFLRKGGCSR